MSKSGRYMIRLPNGRRFLVEPVKERVERALDWTNGGITKPTGGAVAEEESQITPELCKDIQVVQNPSDVIEQALREDGLL